MISGASKSVQHRETASWSTTVQMLAGITSIILANTITARGEGNLQVVQILPSPVKPKMLFKALAIIRPHGAEGHKEPLAVAKIEKARLDSSGRARLQRLQIKATCTHNV